MLHACLIIQMHVFWHFVSDYWGNCPHRAAANDDVQSSGAHQKARARARAATNDPLRSAPSTTTCQLGSLSQVAQCKEAASDLTGRKGAELFTCVHDDDSLVRPAWPGAN
jgi:hypothetical protein